MNDCKHEDVRPHGLTEVCMGCYKDGSGMEIERLKGEVAQLEKERNQAWERGTEAVDKLTAERDEAREMLSKLRGGLAVEKKYHLEAQALAREAAGLTNWLVDDQGCKKHDWKADHGDEFCLGCLRDTREFREANPQLLEKN